MSTLESQISDDYCLTPIHGYARVVGILLRPGEVNPDRAR